jgi:Skp family chaperone for outer membrane proteins
MKTKIASTLMLIVVLVSLSACTEEPIVPVNGKGTVMVSDQAQRGLNEEVVN